MTRTLGDLPLFGTSVASMRYTINVSQQMASWQSDSVLSTARNSSQRQNSKTSSLPKKSVPPIRASSLPKIFS